MATVVKKTQLSLQDKQEILNLLDQKVDRRAICEQFKIAKSTISNIVKRRCEIEEDLGKYSLKLKKKRINKFPQLDDVLLKWYNLQRSLRIPVNGPMMLERANQFADILNLQPEKGEISQSWVSRFNTRHGISSKNISNDPVDNTSVQKWLQTIWPVLSKDYKEEDIFNAAECGLFFKIMPDQCLELKGEKCSGGKMSEDRLTILVCSNATGSEKKKLTLIGKYEQPRSFLGLKPENLPVIYEANSTASVTSEIFKDFCLKWDKLLSRKILLLVENCPAHPAKISGLKNIKLVFFPTNAANSFQPIKQGVTKMLKYLYRREVLKKKISTLETKDPFDMNMKEASILLSKSWNLVKQETIRSCFHRAKVIAPSSIPLKNNNEKTVFKDDVLEILAKLCGVPTTHPNFTMDDYVTFDDAVECCQVPITNKVKDGEVDEQMEQEQDDEEGSSIEPDILNASEALTSLKLLRDFAMATLDSSEAAEKICSALSLLETDITEKQISSLQQSQMTNYLHLIPTLQWQI